jgi:hypothetical protein
VAKAAMATLNIGYDLNNKIDELCYDLLNASLNSGGVFGAFTLTGTKASRVFWPIAASTPPICRPPMI